LQGGAALNETAIEMIVSLLGTRLKLNIVQWLLVGGASTPWQQLHPPPECIADGIPVVFPC